MKVGILGSGAYGVALSDELNRVGNDVTLWTYSKVEKNMISMIRKTPKLPGHEIDVNIFITDEMEKAVDGKDLVIIAVPSYAFDSTVVLMSKFIKVKTPVIIATKGIPDENCLFLHEIFVKHCKNPYGVISGPTFASDIIRKIPVGYSLGTRSEIVEYTIKKCFENTDIKFRRTKDIIGIEICAITKNIIAIAAGMLDGMDVSDSTRALFLTESLNDIKELIEALGGDKKTILSFAGFGDILMTCTSKTSRNFSYGFLIGRSVNQEEIDYYLQTNTVEGLNGLKIITKALKKKKVKIPIINLIYDIIVGKEDKSEIFRFLVDK